MTFRSDLDHLRSHTNEESRMGIYRQGVVVVEVEGRSREVVRAGGGSQILRKRSTASFS